MNTNQSPTMAIILAAGKGTRMESELPKVLVPVSGKPMVRYVTDALATAGIDRLVAVVGYRADLVQAEHENIPDIEFAEQLEQRGTGHAVMMCRQQLEDHQGPVFVVAGDAAMLQASSVSKLLEIFEQESPACVIGSVHHENPTGYGRVVRDAAGNFQSIVEEKDATDEERAIQEINVSMYVFNSSDLLAAFDQLTDNNAQGEYYITDCPALMLAAGKKVSAHQVLDPCEAMSINSMADLKLVEDELQKTQAN
jgi:bifunctional UDP-N-acetylglucosamine pyrophosphorylase/glucosamine-1-phosphate N-acetyltransferase